MYTSIRRYDGIGPGKIDEVIRAVEESFMPILADRAGFLGYYLVAGEDGGIATISMFETKEEAEKSNKAAASWVNENFPEFLENPPRSQLVKQK